VTHARVNIPKWGAWWAEAATDDEAELEGSVTLKLADLTLVGTIVSGAPDRGRSTYRIVGGANGWGRELPPISESNDLGVKASTVLKKAATLVGETLDTSTLPTTSPGFYFVRERAPAGRLLQELAPNAWYVGEDGVTRFGARAALPISVKYAREEFDLARGVLRIAADSIATVLPGVQIDEHEAVDVLHELTPAGLRSTLWTAVPSEHPLRTVVAALFPSLRFAGSFEYRIVSQSSERLNLQAVRVSAGMPDLARVRVRPGVPGIKADHKLGARVLVIFADNDPSRPAVVAFEDADGPGFEPVELNLCNGSLGVARQTDAVIAGPFAGTITAGSSKVKAG
jgi:hypothetical protein